MPNQKIVTFIYYLRYIIKMNLEEYARLLEGRQTVDTVSNLTKLKKTSCLNIVSRLKKSHYLIKTGGGRQKRIYIISPKKTFSEIGMFDILNRYSREKLVPPFHHAVHSSYKIEDAIADLIALKNIRVNISMLPLFNHVKDWNYLYNVSKQKNVVRNVGFFYDIARLTRKTRKMPENIYKRFLESKSFMPYKNSGNNFKELGKKWRLKAPFSKEDLQ